jgi:hypothetical protein
LISALFPYSCSQTKRCAVCVVNWSEWAKAAEQ